MPKSLKAKVTGVFGSTSLINMESAKKFGSSLKINGGDYKRLVDDGCPEEESEDTEESVPIRSKKTVSKLPNIFYRAIAESSFLNTKGFSSPWAYGWL